MPATGATNEAEAILATFTLHRRLPEGGFTIECHSGLDAIIPLPAIEASLSLADLYERVEFAP